MARLARRSLHSDDEQENSTSGVRRSSTRHSTGRRPGVHSSSPSPSASFSSDKENRQNLRRPVAGKLNPLAKPPTPASKEATPSLSKRRKLGERMAPNISQTAHQQALEVVNDTRYYDPDQPMEERRAVRKGMRDLGRELNDSRLEFMSVDSDGLKKTVEKANELYNSVKQTSDATLDSRLLVSAADLSLRRSMQMKLGDASQGIDVDEFVSKCISFMRRGPSEAEVTTLGTQTQRRRRRREGSDEEQSAAENSADEGDAYNWAWLGRKACFPHNMRPAVPGFLLGPLSVQKRVRKQTQRRERLQKMDPKDAVRPEEIKTKDIEQAENSNLTTLCTMILQLLQKAQNGGEAKVRGDVTDDMTDEEVAVVFAKYNMADDGGLSFFHVLVNPRSFGQTVENFFYVSFLIRDGQIGVGKDSNGLPTLVCTKPRSSEEIQAENISKHQAVFHIDFPMWRQIIETFNIKECVIPHRAEDTAAMVGASGWYG